MAFLAWFVSRLFSLDVMPFLALFLPLGGFIVLSLLEPGIRRDREERGAAFLACTTVFLSFLCLLWTALHMDEAARTLADFRVQWRLPPRSSPYMPYQPSLGLDWIENRRRSFQDRRQRLDQVRRLRPALAQAFAACLRFLDEHLSGGEFFRHDRQAMQTRGQPGGQSQQFRFSLIDNLR